MDGRGRGDVPGSHVGDTASFEDLEGMMGSQSGEEEDPDLPLDAFSDFQPPTLSGFSHEEGDNQGFIREEHLTNESLGDILQLDGEHETSGLLNDSELLNHRGQYDSGSDFPSEEDFDEEGEQLGNGSSTDLLQRYMQATPRAETSLPDLNYASDGLNDGSFGYSDDVFNHPEHFYNNNNNDEHYLDGSHVELSDQNQKAAENCNKNGSMDHMNMANGFENETSRSLVDSEILSDSTSVELNDTIVAANGFNIEKIRAGVAEEENYDNNPPDSKDSDSASMSIGQFAPNSVNRNRLPRPVGKPVKRSTPKTNRNEVLNSNSTPNGSVSSRNSPRVSATSSRRSHVSPRYSQRSEDLMDHSSHRRSNGAEIRTHDGSNGRQRPKGVPRLDLRRDSSASSSNLSLSSDPSKLDLSLRLQAESRTRRQADELVDQLQKNYDDLLGKFAQAENTIDQLKLGARVSLYSDGPTPGQSFQGTVSPAHKPSIVTFNQPQQGTLHHIISSRSHTSGAPTGGVPNVQIGHSTMGIQTNNNNKGPTGTGPLQTAGRGETGFPAGEGVLMALAFQAKSLQEQIVSFEMLLRENQIAPSEQKTVLNSLRAEQGKLEADYMRAKEEHNALRRRNSLLSGGGDVTFDPDRALEGEIFQLGMKLEDVAEIVQNNLRNNPPIIISPLHQNQSEEPANGSVELEEQLRQELERRFQKNSRQDEEISSQLGEEERDGIDELQQSDHSDDSIISPRPSQGGHHDAPSLFSPPQPTRPPQTKGADRNSREHFSDGMTNGKRQPKQSQLPRPKTLTSSSDKNTNHDPHGQSNHDHRHDQHRPLDRTRGDLPRQKLPENGIMSPEADSGFMGSESSRQSNQNGGTGNDGRNHLRKPRESRRSSKLAMGQRSPPQVMRRLAVGEFESPKFSDYDISERDEEIEEESLRSSGAGKKRPDGMDNTPAPKGTFQTNRRSSAEKQKQRSAMNAPNQPSGIQLHKQQPGRQHSRDPQQTHERQRPSERRQTQSKTLRNPHPAWADYQDTSYPELLSNSSPKKGKNTSHLRLKNQLPNPARMGRSNERPVNVSRQRPIPFVPPPQQRVYDSVSDVTRSSGKSEAIRDLQGEIERMKRQMAKMNSPKQTRTPHKKEGSSQSRPTVRSSRLDSVGSDVGSGRSEILAALQHEIADLRNQIHDRNRSPPRAYDSPLSRESLRETLRDPRRDDFRDRIDFDSSPPPRSILRDTLRQQYIPRSISEKHSFARTPTQSAALPTGSPYRSRLQNPVPQFESTPYQSSPSYIPDTSSYPESPLLTRQSLHPSHFASPSMKVSPLSGAAHSPVYATRAEPCPMCSGTGVHTHGEYSYPGDLAGRSATNQAQTSHSGPTQYPTQPLADSVPAQAFKSFSNQPQVQASMNIPHHQATFNYPGQSPVNPQLGPTLQFAQNQQPVLNPQPLSNPAQTMISQPRLAASQPPLIAPQQQPVVNEQQQEVYQHQRVVYQHPSVANQQQPLFSQQQPQLNQPQSQPVFSQNHQAVLGQTPTTPVPSQVQTVYTPVGNVPLVTIPVYASVPGNAASQSTSEKSSKEQNEKKSRKSAQKPVRESQNTGGTTIYITPSKRRGRYYVLDDEEVDSTGMEEEYYFRRSPRGSSSRTPSFMRKSRESKHAFNSSIKEALDLEEALKMADKLNQSSHRMLATVQAKSIVS